MKSVRKVLFSGVLFLRGRHTEGQKKSLPAPIRESYRLDHMSSLMDTGESFTVNYGRRFKRRHFQKQHPVYVWPEDPNISVSLYRGPSLGSRAGRRLPTKTQSKKAQKDGSFLITDVIRSGGNPHMWLLSQESG